MNSFKTKLLAFAILFLSITNQTEAQLTKGAYILDFGSHLSQNLFLDDKISVNFDVTYLKLVGERLMVGANLSYFHGYGIYYIDPVGTIIENYTINRYEFNPTIRAYLSNGKLAPFVSVQNKFNQITYSNVEPNVYGFENSFGYQTIVGLGFNYFLSNQIAFEAKASSNLIRLGNSTNEVKYVRLNLGFRLFFNDKISNKVDSLPSKIFKRGNIISSAQFSLSQEFGNYSATSFYFSPNLSYFIRDRLYVHATFNDSYYRSKFNTRRYKSFNLDVGVGLGNYFKLSKSLYLNPYIGFSVSFTDNNFSDLNKEENPRLVVPASIALNYFVKQKKFYLGTEYYKISDAKDVMHIIGGMQYYVFDNVYFSADLNWDITKYIHSSGDSRTNTLTFGMGYLFN